MSRNLFIVWLVLLTANLSWIFWPDEDQDDGSPIALLTVSKGETTLRKSGTFTWKRSKVGSKFFNLDSLSVAPEAEATIRLSDGTELALPGGTQLKFQKRNLSKGIEIALLSGGIVVQRAVPSTKVRRTSAPASVPLSIVKPDYTIDLTHLIGTFKINPDAHVETNEAQNVVVRSKDGDVRLSHMIKPIESIKIKEEQFMKKVVPAAAEPSVLSLFDLGSMAAKKLVQAEWSETAGDTGLRAMNGAEGLVRNHTEIIVPAEEAKDYRRPQARKKPSLPRVSLAELSQTQIDPPPAEVPAAPQAADPSSLLLAIKPKEQAAQLYLQDLREGGLSDAAPWSTFCDHLGKNLSIQSKNRGFLSRFSCQKLGKSARLDAEYQWHIQLSIKDEALAVSVVFGKQGNSVTVASLRYRLKTESLDFLKKEQFAAILAGMMLEKIPTGWAYLHQPEGDEVVMQSDSQFPSTPFQLKIFDLHFDTFKKKWIRKHWGRMTRTSQRKLDGDRRLEKYTIDQKEGELEKGRYYWTQSAAPSKQRQNYYAKLSAASQAGIEVLESLASDFLAPIQSSYVGIRYGLSAVRGSFVVTKAQIFSLLVEFRDGPLSGLRWYYDVVPRVQQGLGESHEYFSLKRASIGWSFAYRAPENFPLFSQIDIQPKIGLLDLDSRIPVQTSRGPSSLSFRAKNIYDFSLEGGVEKKFNGAYVRAWTSLSTAKFGLSNKSQVSVLSSRVGLDAYFDILNRGSRFNVNLLAFAVAENLSLSKKDTSPTNISSPELNDVSFGLLFFGSGIAISW